MSEHIVWPDGAPFCSLRNNVHALIVLKEKFGFSLRAQRVVFYDGRYRPLTARDEARLRWRITEGFGYTPGKEALRDAIRHLAHQNSFDPVLTFIDQLRWDGRLRIDTWLSGYLGVEDTALTRAVGVLFLVAAVRRARRPGVRFDLVPFLVGPQGAGKSRALRILAVRREWFGDNELFNLAHRELVEMLLGTWIYELAERGGLHSTTVERSKAIISRRTDRYRPPYARDTEDIERRFVFIGTTNDPNFLRDASGNRRFLPLHVGRILLRALKRDVLQLWAEAAALEATGYRLQLPKELWDAAAEVQAQAMEVDPWIELLSSLRGRVYGNEERLSYAEIFRHLGIGPQGQSTQQLARIKSCLQVHRWQHRSQPFYLDGRAVRGFVRPANDAANDGSPAF